MKKSRILSKIAVLALALALVLPMSAIFVGCDEVTARLSAPQNVAVSDTGLITWDEVDGADEYLIETTREGGVMAVYLSSENSYQLPDVTKSCTVTVTAKASDKADSEKSAAATFTAKVTEKPPVEKTVSVSIKSATSVRAGHAIDLEAVVSGSDNGEVTWSIVSGGEFVTLSEDGTLSAKELSGSTATVRVRATSKADGSARAEKNVYVVGRQALTQAMLEKIKDNRLSYAGTLDVDYYTTDLHSVYVDSTQISLKTGMDGTDWYATYENNTTQMLSDVFYRNVDGLAYQIGISLMNDEETFPMYDENRKQVTWHDSGLYNTFEDADVKVSDFRFNEDTWLWEYCGNAPSFIDRAVMSANPYEFVPKNLSLIIDEGEIMGMISESEDDYTVVAQYLARMRLTVCINTGDNAEVKKIGVFEHDDSHDKLQTAIDKFHARTSYMAEFVKNEYWLQTGTRTYEGYDEYITDGLCYFEPFEYTTRKNGEIVKHYNRGAEYGYKKITDNLYNSFFRNDFGDFSASRAYSEPFSKAVPNFAFAAEIFTAHATVTDDDKEYEVYFADTSMLTVASEFYKGVGSDSQLYGMYASMPYVGYEVSFSNFTPYIFVNGDDEIETVGFYYNLYYFNGTVEINFYDCDEEDMPIGGSEAIDFTTRYVPTSWDQLLLIDNKGTEQTEDDEEVPAHTFMREFFEDENADTNIPFIGSALGDCFGFGLSTTRMLSWEHRPRKMLALYYDVLLDLDYSIDSSIAAIENYLKAEGFTLAAHGVYEKGKYRIQVVDSDMDLYVYIWNSDSDPT